MAGRQGYASEQPALQAALLGLRAGAALPRRACSPPSPPGRTVAGHSSRAMPGSLGPTPARGRGGEVPVGELCRQVPSCRQRCVAPWRLSRAQGLCFGGRSIRKDPWALQLGPRHLPASLLVHPVAAEVESVGVAAFRLGALKVHVRVSGPLLIPQQPQGLCPPPAGGSAAATQVLELMTDNFWM